MKLWMILRSIHHFSELSTEWQQLIIVVACFLALVGLASTLLRWAWKSKIKRYASIAVILSSIILIGYGMYSSIIDDYERDLQNAGYAIGPSGEMVKSSANWGSVGSVFRGAGRAVKKLFGAGDDLKKVEHGNPKPGRPGVAHDKPGGEGRGNKENGTSGETAPGGKKSKLPGVHTAPSPQMGVSTIPRPTGRMRAGDTQKISPELADRIIKGEAVLKDGALLRGVAGGWFIRASHSKAQPVVVDMRGNGWNLTTGRQVGHKAPSSTTSSVILDIAKMGDKKPRSAAEWDALVAAERQRLDEVAARAQAAALQKIEPEVQNLAKEMQQEAGQTVPTSGSGAPTAPHPGTSDPARPWFNMNHKSNLQKTHNLGDDAFEVSADGAGYRLTETASKGLRDRGQLAAQPAEAATSTRPRPESKTVNPFTSPTTRLPSQAAASAPGAPTMIRIPKAEYDSLAKQYPEQLSPSDSSSKTIFVDTRRLPASDPLYRKIREKECGSDGTLISRPPTQPLTAAPRSTPGGTNPNPTKPTTTKPTTTPGTSTTPVSSVASGAGGSATSTFRQNLQKRVRNLTRATRAQLAKRALQARQIAIQRAQALYNSVGTRLNNAATAFAGKSTLSGTAHLYDQVTGTLSAPARIALRPFANGEGVLGRIARTLENPLSTKTMPGNQGILRVKHPWLNRAARGAVAGTVATELVAGGPLEYWQNSGTLGNLTSGTLGGTLQGTLQLGSGLLPAPMTRHAGLQWAKNYYNDWDLWCNNTRKWAVEKKQQVDDLADDANAAMSWATGGSDADSGAEGSGSSGHAVSLPAVTEKPFQVMDSAVTAAGNKIAPGFGKLPYRSALAGTAIGGLSGGVVGALRYALQDKSLLTKEERKKRSLSRLIASNAGVGAALGGITGGLLDVRNAL